MTLLIRPSGSFRVDVIDGGDEHEHADGWRPRTDADLLAAQLRGLDAWHREHRPPQPSDGGVSREARLDEARRRDVRERESATLHERAAAALRDGFAFGAGAVPRAVVAHRNAWLREKVCTGFRDLGVETVACTDDGAEASAAIVLEQPDLVFVEDLLPTVSGVELIARTRHWAPDAFIGAHALGQEGMSPLLDAGARATFSRRIPPADIAKELVDCLHGRRSVLTLV
jgi:CheY-like chemotaxis protein